MEKEKEEFGQDSGALILKSCIEDHILEKLELLEGN